MNDVNNNITPPADNITPPVDNGENTISGLPSDNIASDFSGFELNDNLKSKFKDGKLNGRFGSIDEVLEKLKETEDKYANTVRDMKNNQTEEQKKSEAKEKINSTIMEVMPDFLANNMQLTPEIEQKLIEAGADIRDVKLGALELKDKIQAAHSVVGGKENYDAMLAWGRDNMTEAQMKDFDIGITNSNTSAYAIKGLYNDYQTAISQGQPPQRIAGNPAVSSVKPYGDRNELFRDRDYINSPAGRRDSAAQARYKARLNITSQDVIYGRK